MPKMKTHRGAAKRFRLTSGGKLVRRRAFKSHILEKKSPKRKRSFRKNVEISPADRREVAQLLGKK
ncbi:50S ribosomal protein L35 [bacterium BMS3Abin01]|nr:50S ribosomal protein L35 [bacterium BMS3Abin01]HDZ59167.1 50S ribosomal protein L35 [Actinomycetota bacterium]HDZ59966.1 50S ribosomal protein L35 [Actinomycetota bacterium]